MNPPGSPQTGSWDGFESKKVGVRRQTGKELRKSSLVPGTSSLALGTSSPALCTYSRAVGTSAWEVRSCAPREVGSC